MLSLSSCSQRALYILRMAGFVSDLSGNYGWIFSHSVVRNFIVTQQPCRPTSPKNVNSHSSDMHSLLYNVTQYLDYSMLSSAGRITLPRILPVLAVPYVKDSSCRENLILWGVLLTCEPILVAIPLNTCSTDHINHLCHYHLSPNNYHLAWLIAIT